MEAQIRSTLRHRLPTQHPLAIQEYLILVQLRVLKIEDPLTKIHRLIYFCLQVYHQWAVLRSSIHLLWPPPLPRAIFGMEPTMATLLQLMPLLLPGQSGPKAPMVLGCWTATRMRVWIRVQYQALQDLKFGKLFWEEGISIPDGVTSILLIFYSKRMCSIQLIGHFVWNFYYFVCLLYVLC